MMGGYTRFGAVRFAGRGALLVSLCFVVLPSRVAAQTILKAERRIAFASGRGSLSVKAAQGGELYVLNREDKCVWLFDSGGSSRGHISSVGMGPADLLEPMDLAVDKFGSAIVADASGMIKIFDKSGKLSGSFPFKRPEQVSVLSDGRILVSGFPTTALIEVFDRNGHKVGQIGEPIVQDDNPFFNSVLNAGIIAVDDSDNIFYVFRFRTTPTVRRYTAAGVLLSEWTVKAPHLDDLVAQAKAKYAENKQAGQYGGVPLFTAASFDIGSRTLWLASLDTVFQVDDRGETTRFFRLRTPELRPVQARGLQIEGNTVRAASLMSGVYEIVLPK